MELTPDQIKSFRETVWQYFKENGRVMPWRVPEKNGQFDPYKIMVSEVMLQQTQVVRVMPKFTQFIERFPTISSVASESLGGVLAEWSGLGYNRRAKFLWQAAQDIMTKYGGRVPQTASELTDLPGIGANTAAAVLVYSFNKPHVFIETNIRTVYIHHFFPDKSEVTDKELMILVDQTLDVDCPREWYWALMDFGTHIKQQVGNVSKNSKHYTKQSKFEGSIRQLRGSIIRQLTISPSTKSQLANIIKDERLEDVLGSLEEEGLIRYQEDVYSLL